MKKLLESFKKEIGEILVNFGNKLTGEIEKTNLKVKSLEERLEKLEGKTSKSPVPKKPKTIQLSKPTNTENLDLLRKFNKEKICYVFDDYTCARESKKIYLNQVTINERLENAELGRTFIKGYPVHSDVEIPFSPTIDTGNFEKINITYEMLIEAIKMVKFASNGFDSLNLYGVRIVNKNNIATLIASDSYRLIKLDLNNASDDFEITLNRKTLECIKKDFTKYGKDVQVFKNGNLVKITYNNRVVISEILQQFPNVNRIIEEYNFEVEKEMFKIDLKKATEIVKSSTDDKVLISDNKLSIKASDTVVKSMEINGDLEGMRASFNFKFLKEALELNPVTIKYNKFNSSQPIFLKGKYDILIMPCVIKD